MPLYEYQCLPERHSFEVRQGINDDPVVTCPECGGAVRRVIQPVGIVFKGSGFYVNDSRKSTSTTTPAPAGKAGESSSDGKTDGGSERSGDAKASEPKTESKPAPKAETAAGS